MVSDLNKNQKIIIASIGPIIILLLTYWVAHGVADAQSNLMYSYGPFDFNSAWIAIIWIASISLIGAMEWLLFGKEN
jgi:ABC-type antimicrobial peptide transport system permease subunit